MSAASPATFRIFRAVARRELHGRAPLVVAALALGLLPFALPLLPQARGQSAADLRVVAAPMLTALGTVLLALLLGAELLSRELAERRIGFYLARPIGLGTLWAAKVASAYTVLAAATLLMIAPVALVDRLLPPLDVSPAIGVLLAAGTLLLLLLAASALAIFVRARSARLAIDVIVLLLASTLAGSAVMRLLHAGAATSLALGMSLFGAASIASLYAAHAAALEHGRSDLGRASRVLSVRLWTLLLPSTAAFALFAAWTLSPTPSALREVWRVDPSPRGDWVAVCGRLAGRFDLETVFLWHPPSRKFYRIPAGLPHGFTTRVAFSASGNAAAWVEREGTQWAVWRLDLDAALRGGAQPERTTVSFVGMPNEMVLSPDGRLLASRPVSRWTLDDLATGKLLASIPDDDVDVDARWVSNDRLRIFGLSGFDSPTLRARAWELTAATAAPRPLFSVSAPLGAPTLWISDLNSYGMMRASPDGRRALVRDHDGWRLIDADSGAFLASIAPFQTSPGDRRHALPVFLGDGRILTRRSLGDGFVFDVLDRDGAPTKELRPNLGGRVFLGSQPAPQKIWLLQAGSTPGDPRLLELDLEDGSIVERGHGLLPAAGFGTEFDAQTTGDGARWLIDQKQRLRFLPPGGTVVDPLGD